MFALTIVGYIVFLMSLPFWVVPVLESKAVQSIPFVVKSTINFFQRALYPLLGNFEATA